MPLSLRCEIVQMFNPGNTLHEVDPELWAAVQQENQRQEDHVELIASENYASRAVLAAQGSQLTNKYAEGYPGKRYYGGCEFVDIAEQLAIVRARQLFGCDYANVLYPSPIGIADFITSTTHKTLRGPRGGLILAGTEHEKILNAAVFPCLQGGPLMHVIAAKAVAFKEALAPEFRAYQKQVITNARTLAKTLQSRGVRIVSGGTDCHMLLVDLRAKNVTGRDAEDALGRAHITVNKNAIPNDPQKPFVAGGIRIGSPAMTTRGFRESEAAHLGELIADVLDAPHDDKIIKRVTMEVSELCRRFPVYRAAEAGGGQRVAAA